MQITFHNFVISLLAFEQPLRNWNDKIAGSNKLKGVMPLACRVWLEHNRGRHFSRIKLTYEIAPRVVSENTALRMIEKFIDRGYLKECGCHGQGGAPGLKPTEKFISEFEETLVGMIRNFDSNGFLFSPEKTNREDFILWSTREGKIIDAVHTEEWLGVQPHELIGTRVQSLFADDWVKVYGGPTGLNQNFKDTFDQIFQDSRRIVLTPTLVNQADGSLVQTKVLLSMVHSRVHGKPCPHEKTPSPIRRSAYEVLKTSKNF